MIRLTNELQNVKTVAVAGHIRPDGDCTGSCLAAASYIQENFPGISVDVYLEGMNPNFLFLKGARAGEDRLDGGQRPMICLSRWMPATGSVWEKR